MSTTKKTKAMTQAEENVQPVADPAVDPLLVAELPYTNQELIDRLQKGTYMDVEAAGYGGTQQEFNEGIAKLLTPTPANKITGFTLKAVTNKASYEANMPAEYVAQYPWKDEEAAGYGLPWVIATFESTVALDEQKKNRVPIQVSFSPEVTLNEAEMSKVGVVLPGGKSLIMKRGNGDWTSVSLHNDLGLAENFTGEVSMYVMDSDFNLIVEKIEVPAVSLK